MIATAGLVGLGRFRQGEITAAQNRYSHGGKIIGADAVVARTEGEPLGGCPGLVIFAHVHAGALNGPAERDHSKRRRRRDA